MKIRRVLFFLFVSICNLSFASDKLDSILTKLDETIRNHEVYASQRESRIRELKTAKAHVKPSSVEYYDMNMALYKEYKAFICDSAVHYLNENVMLAQRLNDPARETKSKLLLSYQLSSAGMYKEAVDVLESISRSQLSGDFLGEYYSCQEHVYGELCCYTQDKVSAGRYWQVSQNYRDSLQSVLNPDNDRARSIQEAELRDKKEFANALKMNDKRMSGVAFGTPEYALVTFHRALIYKYKEDSENEKMYLALSAMSDIQSAIEDHASLWMLAQILYTEGNIERAYLYIRFSWNSTSIYNARLRSLQSAGILSLIDKTYQAMSEKQNRTLQFYLLLISTLTILLIAAMIYIYRQMKRLSLARNHLQSANGQLKSLNAELQQMNGCLQAANTALSESNHIKEEYIARFIKLCSTYIDKLDGYRRMVNRKISAGHIDELYKITRSQNALDDELKELYANFDTAFLHLFPDFVDKFNSMLQEEGRIVLKKGELLNTELRIFALIRLGIDDSSQIAEFLRYSVNTIYNYRAKVKNKASVSRDDFEKLVAEIR